MIRERGTNILKNYIAYHVHSDLSLLDSCTKFQQYVDRAVELKQKAIAITEHGNIYQWVAKKMYCDEKGIKYLHGVECYLTSTHLEKERDNYHTILIAKNYAGVLELNRLISLSTEESHTYYKPRLSFDEFLGISNNIIKISACLASPLNKLPVSHKRYRELAKHYDYFEIQAHNHEEQKQFNLHLAQLAQELGKPLIAGTDTHSIDKYKAECRSILLAAKHIEYSDEDAFDLTYKSYDELVEMFAKQNALPENIYLKAIENTNIMADSVEPFDLDFSFKYPQLYGEKDREILKERIGVELESKIESGIIKPEHIEGFKASILEECRVFDKIDMSGFMLFMSELVTWCKQNDIPVGFNRGSCGGSRVAYITNITDLNPEEWRTVFSRFCNEDRKEIGDIDIDVAPSDREKVYDYIINRFGQSNTAYILAIGTIKSKGCIDEICRALSIRWNKEHQHDSKSFQKALAILRDENVSISFGEVMDGFSAYCFDESGKLLLPDSMKDIPRAHLIKQFTQEYSWLKERNEEIFKKNPWSFGLATTIKKEWDIVNPPDYPSKKRKLKDLRDAGVDSNEILLLKHEIKKIEEQQDSVRSKYPDIFYFYDGLIDTAISQSMHPAGMVASPITLHDNYGIFESGGKTILQVDMECVHEVGLVKYDILGLKNIEVIKDAYKLIGKPYPFSHEIDWGDSEVWADMLRSPVGIFQFEGDFAFSMLRRYKPQSVFDMSLVTAALRPSGASYRNRLMERRKNKNPSIIIDDLLKENNGYLIYQEDTIKFLQQICGLSGSEADNIRRAIGRKDKDRLEKALPQILEGYCNKSSQPRTIAEQEAKEFLQIIEDSASYQFGYNHSIGYCMIGYVCAYLRYYYPFEFITSYLNNANNEDDVKNGSALAELYGIRIVPPRFGLSKDRYVFDKEQDVIAKGLESIKFMNSIVANELFALSEQHKPKTFMEMLLQVSQNTSLNTRQRDILVKIDYFSDFGNIPELSRMIDLFAMFKDGSAKRISKEKLSGTILEIISQFASDTNKNGTIAKSFVINDMVGLLNACENMIRSLDLPDVDLKVKIQNQFELMGYIDLTTKKPEDRRKLLVTDLYPLANKEKGEIWGYAINTRSIGTGKTARLTIRSRRYEKTPIKRHDIICARELEQNQKGYWYLLNYDLITI